MTTLSAILVVYLCGFGVTLLFLAGYASRRVKQMSAQHYARAKAKNELLTERDLITGSLLWPLVLLVLCYDYVTGKFGQSRAG